MTDPAKVRRQAERVRELVVEVVRTQIKDPRVGMITITDSRITGDLREATIFYTVLGDAEEQKATAAALESAKGLLRSTVGRALGLKHSPTLAFVQDDVQDTAKHIDELLAAARESDAKVHELAVGASYAGDAQPYRVADLDLDGGLVNGDLTDTDTDTGTDIDSDIVEGGLTGDGPPGDGPPADGAPGGAVRFDDAMLGERR